jgi:periplasmic copper chaperone A
VTSNLRLSAFICVSLLAAPPCFAEATVKDAWIRGTVPAQKTTGAFFTITSTEDAKLVAVASPIADMVELHLTENKAGVMHMHGIEGVELPANKPVKLAPGGAHVMLMGLKAPVKAGTTVPLTLTVQDRKGKRSTVEVAASVRPLGQ